MTSNSYPRVIIEYCAKCKWQNRAVWYLQELLQTFDGKLFEISLKPVYDTPGIFKVVLEKSNSDGDIIYQKKLKKTQEPQNEGYYYDGFPDSKFLKVLLRNELFPDENLGHIDKYDSSNKLNEGEPQPKGNQSETSETSETSEKHKESECEPCKSQQ